MGSAATGEPPPKDYIRLYKLSKAEHALSSVAGSRIKVTRIFEANDPFELMALNFRASTVRTAVAKYRTAEDSTNGLLCFSADWTSPLLWSNYADSHRGICLGFDVRRSFVEQVKYRDKRIRAELDDEDPDPYALSPKEQDLLRLTKCHEWKYEQEWRRVVPLSRAINEGGIFLYPFGDDVRLAEVIVGPNCGHPLDKVRSQVRRYHPAAMTFCARLAWQHFKVVPREKTVP